MAVYFKNAKKDIIRTGEDYRNNDICRFCEKKFLIKFVIIVT